MVLGKKVAIFYWERAENPLHIVANTGKICRYSKSIINQGIIWQKKKENKSSSLSKVNFGVSLFNSLPPGKFFVLFCHQIC